MSFRGQPPPPQPSQRFLGGLWQSAFARWCGHDHQWGVWCKIAGSRSLDDWNAVGAGIALRRSNGASIHRPWRANFRQGTL